MVNFNNIPAFCINLDFRRDRWESIRAQFDSLGWPVNRVSAVEAFYPPGFNFNKKWVPGSPLMPGQAACMASHRRVWELAVASEAEVVAVFEDDALFPSDFNEVFVGAYKELPPEWRLWHLHSFGPNQEATLKKLGKFITVLSSNGYGSHGYLIRRGLMEMILSRPVASNEPVDWFLTVGLASRGEKVYGTLNEKAICFQKTMNSNIKETRVDDYYEEMNRKYYR